MMCRAGLESFPDATLISSSLSTATEPWVGQDPFDCKWQDPDEIGLSLKANVLAQMTFKTSRHCWMQGVNDINSSLCVSALFPRVGFMFRLALPAGDKLRSGSSFLLSYSIATPIGKKSLFPNGFNKGTRMDSHWPLSSHSFIPKLWPEGSDHPAGQAWVM